MVNPSDWPSTHLTLINRLKESIRGEDWDRFVEVYTPLIFRFCCRRGLQDADARDVTQNTFVAVRKGIAHFAYDPERGKFRGWLGTITTHEILRYRQQSQRAGIPLPEVTDGTGINATTDASWIVEFNSYILSLALRRIRDEFEPMTWNAFELVWLRDMKSSEVAEHMGKTVDWVYQAKFRVFHRLEKEILFLTSDIPGIARDS